MGSIRSWIERTPDKATIPLSSYRSCELPRGSGSLLPRNGAALALGRSGGKGWGNQTIGSEWEGPGWSPASRLSDVLTW